MNKPMEVADDMVVSLEYTLKVNDQIVDSTENDDPLQFIQGHKNIIPGLERELYGMKIGETKKVTVEAKDAYGQVNPEALIEVPRSEFPAEIPMEEGIQLQVRDMSGEVRDARIEKVGSDTVTLDFNHPLAGQSLHFDVTITDLRSATEDELEHGHVHDGLEEEDDFEDEEMYEDDEELEDEEEYSEEDELEEEGFYIVDEEDDDIESDDLKKDTDLF